MLKAMFRNVRNLRVDGAVLPSGVSSPDSVERSVCRVLDNNVLCAWATVTAEGRAHINIGYFAHSAALELYLWSHPSSLHCRNLTVNPSMAVAVFSSSQNWTDPGRGVQLFGSCAEVAEPNTADAARVYEQRFEAYAGWREALRPGDPALEYRFYRFVPERVKVLDEAEFGDGVFVEAEIVRVN